MVSDWEGVGSNEHIKGLCDNLQSVGSKPFESMPPNVPLGCTGGTGFIVVKICPAISATARITTRGTKQMTAQKSFIYVSLICFFNRSSSLTQASSLEILHFTA